MDFKSKIDALRQDLNSVLDLFLTIKEENFYENINQIKSVALQVKKNKEELRLLVPGEVFKKFNLEIEDMTKKIKICFDDIVEEKEKEIEKVSFELKKLTNQRKLTLYKR